MKNTLYTTILAGLLAGSLTSCTDTFLDLQPLDEETDAVYFQDEDDFKEYATTFYDGMLLGWTSSYGSIYEHMDNASDLAASSSNSYTLGHGTIEVSSEDSRWDKCYANIRTVNILLEKAEAYTGDKADIQQYISEAYFFRAYNYFYLLKFFGGVPIVTTVLDVDSPELMGARNSRYEVVDRILADLDLAIEGLPMEANIADSEKGRVSYHAAEAFKARVLLYEATWRNYNGTSTDFEGSGSPASNQVIDFLTEAISLCEDVMENGGYEIWNYNSNSSMNNMSNRYLFCLEDGDTNPAGLTKASNKEFILYSVFDQTSKPGGINLNATVTKMDASRKLMDMFLCTDGLPITQSGLFQGYKNPGDEFTNRDYRMKSCIFLLAANSTFQESFDDPDNVVLNIGRSGYTGAKFYNEERESLTESANYPVIRLAEVYLNYAEAVYEKNRLENGTGSITDAQLNNSINHLRNRAGVANLTNALVTNNGLDMLNEIRRERAIELYMEGFRFDDLKRWGIAETNQNTARYGMVVGNAGYATAFVDNTGTAISSRYSPATYVYGAGSVSTPVGDVNSVILDVADNYSFSKTHYLWPIPQSQIDMNPNLVQNPGY